MPPNAVCGHFCQPPRDGLLMQRCSCLPPANGLQIATLHLDAVRLLHDTASALFLHLGWLSSRPHQRSPLLVTTLGQSAGAKVKLL